MKFQCISRFKVIIGFKVSIILVSFFASTSCSREVKLVDYSDPYLEAFFERRIKTMNFYNPNDSLNGDSLRRQRVMFDRIGNIIHVTGFMTNDTMAYNSQHFITRKIQRLDAPANFVVTYDFDNNGNLIQVWNSLRHRNWEFDSGDLDQADKDTVKFEINKEGRIAKEQDSEKTTMYFYKEHKLIRKEIFLNKTRKLLYTTLYAYTADKVKTIEYYNGEELYKTHYFSNHGLLDSTEHFFKGQRTITKYRYSFF